MIAFRSVLCFGVVDFANACSASFLCLINSAVSNLNLAFSSSISLSNTFEIVSRLNSAVFTLSLSSSSE